MEGLVILLILIALWLVIAPIVALVKANDAQERASKDQDLLKGVLGRLKDLENELRQIKRSAETPPQPRLEEPTNPQGNLGRLKELENELLQVKPDAGSPPQPCQEESAVSERNAALETVLERVMMEERRIAAAEAAVPPPIPASQQRRKLIDTGEGPTAQVKETEQESVAWQAPKEPFSLEQFMGAKLFAWLGGVAMFFGVIFFVKYAFERNLIPPELRVTLGFLTGIGLLIGGLLVHRLPRYRVLAQAFCATGVVSLYGVNFAAHSVYHFAAFGSLTTFGLMALITLVAFLLAVRLDALVVAVLGMLGGFLTPVLLSTGQDNVLGLFGYIALLDIGLLAVSRHGGWRFLTSSAAAGTTLMLIGWYSNFFTSGEYFVGSRTLIPMGVLLFFIALFLGGGWKWKREPHSEGAVLGLVSVAMLFAFAMLDFDQVATRYFLLYGFMLLVQLAVIALVMTRPQLGIAQVLAAGSAFIHLAFWTWSHLTGDNLQGALVLYLGFAALHSVVPVLLTRRFPDDVADFPLRAGPWFAPLALLMMLLPLFHLTPIPMAIWVAILLLDLMVIALAVVTGAIIPVLASLLLTMGVAAVWLLRIPVQAGSLMPFLGVITGFSAVFAVAGKWLSRGATPDDGNIGGWKPDASILPVCSGVLPFALLILALLHLPVANPSPVFGVALLMGVLLTGLAIIGKQGQLVLVAMVCTLAVEGVWHLNHFKADAPGLALGWYLGFYTLFLVFPFVFRKACAGQAAPWIASALTGVGHFLLIHDLVKRAYPNNMMGMLPAAFAVPALIALFVVIRSMVGMNRSNRSQLAWFGGVALFFITLIFPIQFDRQWLTVSWALEGALLLWLFRRVPHPGLQLTGLALLAISFVRLTLNPAVFSVYPRSGTAILNWHLYTYGLVAAAQFLGGFWFTEPAGWSAKFPPRGVLYSLGGVLLFLLLNIEIADYFTDPGETFIAFNFGGNFARDMTYTIAWGLFSLGLLGAGFRTNAKYVRFTAIALLAITLIKLFLHDLAAIQNIFRIGALVGVAVIAFIASFLYQRFYESSKP